ncbi:hypothetical protein ACIP5Y_43705 [Nocardia sp. NPDC088792]|uniref:hypothetical protein n=1 Tax=Nocardia sp. NPDC088792 TaxID=3364332 RepID=UPI003830C9C4
MSFDITGKSIDQILDHGAPGLQYWERFLPLYEKAFGIPRPGTGELQARYDEQRGTNLAELDTARAELAKALTEAETQLAAHRDVATGLPGIWSGGAGIQAIGIAEAQVRQARGDIDAAQAAAKALEAVLQPLRQAALTKAEHTLALLEENPDGTRTVAIGGKTPGEIDALLTEHPDPWLTNTFKRDVESKLDAFNAACRTADEFFESEYESVIAALGSVVEAPYPHPVDLPISNIPQPPPRAIPLAPQSPAPQPIPQYAVAPQQAQPAVNSVPVQPQSAPSHDNPPQSIPASSHPDPMPVQNESPRGAAAPDMAVRSQPQSSSTLPADSAPASMERATSQPESMPQFDNAGRSIIDSLSRLAPTLGEGLTGAADKIRTLIESATPKPSDPTNPDPATTDPGHATDKAELDIAGKHFTLERTPTGELQLTVTDESGATHTYTLGLDNHGLPTVTESTTPAKPEAPSPDHQSSPSTNNPAAFESAAPPSIPTCPNPHPQVDQPNPAACPGNPQPPAGDSPPPSADSTQGTCPPVQPPCVDDSHPGHDGPSIPDTGAPQPGCPASSEPENDSFPPPLAGKGALPPAQSDHSPLDSDQPPEPGGVNSSQPDTNGAIPPAGSGPLPGAPGASQPDGSVPTQGGQSEPNPPPALGDTDPSVEIPDSGVEIPEPSQGRSSEMNPQ